MLVLAFFLQKEVQLEHEWKIIMNDFLAQKGYRMYGFSTAYMPPFYSYYLLICKNIFGFTNWIKVSCIIQAVIYYYSMFYLFKTFLKNSLYQWRIVIFFLSVVFFPPIFVGNVSVSSFSLSVSILSVFFTLLFKIFSEEKYQKRHLYAIALASIAGLYIRYEFLYIIVLSSLIFIFLKKINVISFIKILFFIFLVYLPWMMRNYIEIGKLSYATSLNYNFAKGYNEAHDVFSSYNFPYNPETKQKLPINVLYKQFENEKQIDEHLSALNREFILKHPVLFLKLTLQKLLINILQYFPNYDSLSSHKIYVFYSLFFAVFQAFLIWAMAKLKSAKRIYLLTFTVSFYMFFIFFYSISPMPRYFLLFYPVFFVVIIKSFEDKNGGYTKLWQKKIVS